MKVSVFTDGGSRGNPGPSGFGVVIYTENKKILAQISRFIGTATNNEAEYSALVKALSWLRDNITINSITHVTFHSDSQLLVRQMQGKYKVKAPNIRPLFAKATKLLTDLNIDYQFKDIPREDNSLADELANQAMDRKS